jgi:hypothetical protein
LTRSKRGNPVFTSRGFLFRFVFSCVVIISFLFASP